VWAASARTPCAPTALDGGDDTVLTWQIGLHPQSEYLLGSPHGWPTDNYPQFSWRNPRGGVEHRSQDVYGSGLKQR
jgi:hypothetical protein